MDQQSVIQNKPTLSKVGLVAQFLILADGLLVITFPFLWVKTEAAFFFLPICFVLGVTTIIAGLYITKSVAPWFLYIAIGLQIIFILPTSAWGASVPIIALIAVFVIRQSIDKERGLKKSI